MRCRLPLLLLLSSLPACLELEQTITIAADGSGTQNLRLALGEATLAQVRRTASVMEAGALDPLQVFDKQAVTQELRLAGMELTAHAASEQGDQHRVAVAASFKNLATLRKSPLCGSLAQWEFAPGPKAGTIRVTFWPQGKDAWVQARKQAEAMQTTTDPTVTEFFQKRKQQLVGLDLVLRLKLPGKVLVWTRNLEKTGDQEVVAHITAAQIQTPADLVRRLAPRFEVILDGAGCSLPLDDK